MLASPGAYPLHVSISSDDNVWPLVLLARPMNICWRLSHDTTSALNPAQFRPEVLERVLRVVRHRGFRLCALNMAPQLDCQDLQITVTVESERPIQLLHSQLAKLIDVIQVEAGEVRQAHTAAYSIRA